MIQILVEKQKSTIETEKQKILGRGNNQIVFHKEFTVQLYFTVLKKQKEKAIIEEERAIIRQLRGNTYFFCSMRINNCSEVCYHLN
jgi:hypothetical protein